MMSSFRSLLCAAIVIATMAPLSASCPDTTWTPSALNPNRCYFPVPQRLSWFAAVNFCKGKAPGAEVSSISSNFESHEITAVLENAGVHNLDAFWLGAACDARGCHWFDGTPFTYTNWYKNQPNPTNDCVVLEIRLNSQWITTDCGEPHFVVCAV